MISAREFWVAWDNRQKHHISIPEFFINQPLAEQYGKPFMVIEKSAYDALARDHDDDWKRIQDAERALEQSRAEVVEANRQCQTAINQHSDSLNRNQALEKELAEAKAELKMMTGAKDIQVSRKRNLHDKYATLQEQLKAMREGLEFYADKNNWEKIEGHTTWASNLKIKDCAFLNCGGGRARKLLEETAGGLSD